MPLKDQIRLVFHAVLSGSKDVPRYIVAYHYTRAIIYKGKPLYVSFYGILIEIQKQSLVFCSVGLGPSRSLTRLLSGRTKMMRAALGPVRKRPGLFRAGRGGSARPEKARTNTSILII